MAYDNNTKDQYGKSINDYKAAYAAASARGDAAGMAAANAAANAIRTAGGGTAEWATADINRVRAESAKTTTATPTTRTSSNTGAAGGMGGYAVSASSYTPATQSYTPLAYTSAQSQTQNRTQSTPVATSTPATTTTKDYTTLIREAIARGASAAEVTALNNQRNAKIAASGGTLNQYKDDVADLVSSYVNGMNSYFPSTGGTDSMPAYYAQNANLATGRVLGPDGKTYYNLHDWTTDTTDYGALALNATSSAELLKYLQDRVHKANAQGIDISQGNEKGYKSNQDIYNEWYAKNGPQAHDYIINGQVGRGYYGMDGNGNWGYYDDPALTQKSAGGGWDTYRSSDGGPAAFNLDSLGRVVPYSQRDPSRAGKTIIMAAGSKAYECEFNDLGYIVSWKPVNVDPSTLYVAQQDPARDQGVSGRDLLQQGEGVTYAGPGANIDTSSIRGATRSDWEAVMAARNGGTAPTGTATGAGGEEASYAAAMAGLPSGGYGSYGGYTASAGGYGTPYSGTSLTDELKSLYNGTNSPYMQALADLRAANEAAVQRTANALEGRKEDVNSSYSDLFRQLYIDRMRNQKNIGQRMAAQGVTGGMAESTLLGLGTQYEDALRQGEQSRIGTISDLDRAIEDARLTGDISTAENAVSLARENVNNYADVLRNLIAQQNADRAYNYQLSRDAVADQRYASEWAYQQQQQAAQLAYQRQQASAGETAANRSYAYKTAMQLIDSGYMPSTALLDAAGIDTASAQALVASAQAERTAEEEKAASAAAKPTLTAAQVNAAIKAGNLTPAVLSAYEYYYGQPYGRS